VYTVFMSYSHSYTLSPHFPHSHWYQSTRQDLLCLSVLLFCKRKEWHFCLFKIVTQGVSLWHSHEYIYYDANWFISSVFLLSTLVPFLWWFQQV
jgi:hypothetical protein